jgi:rhodanese-related sulfurtransferase
MNKIFLDVRSEEEFKENGIEGSLNIPHTILLNNLHKIPKNSEVFLYCRSGKRAGIIEKVLEALEYNVTNIETVENAVVKYNEEEK